MLRRFLVVALCWAPVLAPAQSKPWACSHAEAICAEAGASSRRCKAQKDLFANKCADYWSGPGTEEDFSAPNETYSQLESSNNSRRVLDRQRAAEEEFRRAQQLEREEGEAAAEEAGKRLAEERQRKQTEYEQDIRKTDYLKLQIEAVRKDMALATQQMERDGRHLQAYIDSANSTAMSQAQRSQVSADIRSRKDAYLEQYKKYEWAQMQRQHELDDLMQQHEEIRRKYSNGMQR